MSHVISVQLISHTLVIYVPGVTRAASTFWKLEDALIYQQHTRSISFIFFFKVQTQRRATGFDMKQEQRPNRVMQKLVGDLFVTALNTAAEL